MFVGATDFAAYTKYTARGSMAVATVRLTVCLLAFLLAAGLADGQSAQPEVQTEPLNAGDIMARVAANQDRSQALRRNTSTNSISTSRPISPRKE